MYKTKKNLKHLLDTIVMCTPVLIDTLSGMFGGAQYAAVAMLLNAVHHRQQGIKRQKMGGKQALHWEGILKCK